MSPIYFIVCVHVVAYCISSSAKTLPRTLRFTTSGEAPDSEALNYPAPGEAIRNTGAKSLKLKNSAVNFFSEQ
jgi:hypothetical protein